MRRILQALALLIMLLAAGTWLVTGAHHGWTKTSVQKKTLDEVTGLEAISYERRFLAGLDFLGAALLGASLSAGVSFLFRQPQTKPKTEKTKP